MGDINPSKMPNAKKTKRRDSTDFESFAEGGNVNAAGNYTKPELRKRIVSSVKAAATHGTGAGSKAGKQFVAQPKAIAKKTAGYR